jgi:ABC-type uncharacterized transport system auxiliary subunit
MSSLSKKALIFLLTLALSGCFSFGGGDEKEAEIASPHYYIVDVDRGEVAQRFATGRVLLLKPVRVVPHFRSTTLMYRVGENEYQPQTGQELITEPSDMFTSQLRRWLEKSGLFSRVITDDSQAADYVLEAAVTAMYGDSREKYTPMSVLEMQFFLSAADDKQQKVLFQTGYRLDADLDTVTPSNVVNGWKQGLKTLLTTLEEDMSDYFSKRGGK